MASDIDRLVAAARQWPSGGDAPVKPVSTNWSWSHSLFRAELDGRRVIVKVIRDVSRDEHLHAWVALCVLADRDLAPELVCLAVGGGRPAIGSGT